MSVENENFDDYLILHVSRHYTTNVANSRHNFIKFIIIII